MKLTTFRTALTAGLWTVAGWLPLPCRADAKAPNPVRARKAPYQVGKAAWYGRVFQGRRTANGEVFDARALTAAHRRLPFGSLVRVTNLANGKSVVVRVNDRGPWHADRVIDLSYAASKALGMLRAGVGRVRLETVPASVAIAGD